MAIHFLECAAGLQLPASKKLALMALADDADKETRIGSCGLDSIMLWSGLRKSRALDVLAELVADGLIARERGGRIGRRAEFVVFPDGCCALHGPVRRGSGQSDPAPRAVTVDNVGDYLGTSVDNSDPGSGAADPAVQVEGPIEGPIEGPVATGPLPISLSVLPPNPHEVGGLCNPQTPVHLTGCRPCGTSKRQVAEAERKRQSRVRAAECDLHRGQPANHCSPCRSERIGAAS